MTVYLLVNDSPEDFDGGYHLLAIYQHRTPAEKRAARLKKRDPYRYQYLAVLPRMVFTRRPNRVRRRR